MSIYDSEATAVARLIKGKKPECVDALEKVFWQTRGEGKEVREAYHKAEFVHFIKDHNGLAESPTDFQVKTDNDVRAFVQQGVEKSLAAGETDGQELGDIVLNWYNLGRSWGGDVFTSYTLAVNVVDEIFEEQHDLSEEDAEAALADFPIDEYKELVRNEYLLARAEGDTVQSSLEHAKNVVQNIYLRDLFSGILGGSNLPS